MKDIFLMLMFNILKNYMNLIMIYHFYQKQWNIIHIRNLKQELNNGLVSKKTHSVIKFNQSASLKLYINMNTDLR